MSVTPAPAPSNPSAAAPPTNLSRKAATSPNYIVLTGNPNCGKTTLFNALTGLRAKVGNYAGVTVERKEGRLLGVPAGLDLRILDLPGTYSLSPQSLDEQISRDVLLTRLPELPLLARGGGRRCFQPPTKSLLLHTSHGARLSDHHRSEHDRCRAPERPRNRCRKTFHASICAGRARNRQQWLRAEGTSGKNCRAGGKTTGRPTRSFCKLPPTFDSEADALATQLAQVFHERRTQARAEALLI